MKSFSKLILESKTAPWLKKGEILVCFKNTVTLEVVKYFLDKLKLKMRKRNNHEHDKKYLHISLGPHNMEMEHVYVVQVPAGKEDEYIHKLKSELGKDIEWAERRNIKMELRSYLSEYCAKALEDLGFESEISDSDWKSRYDHLIELMKLISEDNYETIRGMYSEFDSKFKEI